MQIRYNLLRNSPGPDLAVEHCDGDLLIRTGNVWTRKDMDRMYEELMEFGRRKPPKNLRAVILKYIGKITMPRKRQS